MMGFGWKQLERRRFWCVLPVITFAFALQAQRLPDTVIPNHYTLKLAPDPKTGSFTGEEIIDADLKRPTKQITLNAIDIDFQRVTVQMLPDGEVQTATVQTDAESEAATLAVPNELAMGPVEINIQYRGTLNDQLRGFYVSKGARRNYAVTQMEPTDARRVFPGWDEPAYKASFNISAVVDNGDTAISNAPIEKDEPGPLPGKHTITFVRTQRMPTYLVALAVGDWTCTEGSSDGVRIRICATPDNVRLTNEALRAAESILHFYNQWYAQKYPYGKLDVLAVPDFSAGAMENTGAIFYREVLLFWREGTSSAALQKTVWDVLAHEMAHQWFGDLVTMRWWNDLWLNEGFATWMSPKAVRAAHPEWNSEMDQVESAQLAMNLDSLASTRPIRQDATTSAEIGELFDVIAYSKTAAVLRMLEKYEGADVFQKGTNDYLIAHQYADATAEDFWDAQAKASGQPIDKVMASFVLQPGLPLVSVGTRCVSGKTEASVRQQRFFSNRRAMNVGSNEIWQIPVCLKYGTGGRVATQCQLVTTTQATTTLPVCAEWLQANADATGYYRTAYGPNTYKKLLEVVQSALSPEERLSLVDNQWALVRSGSSDVGDFLGLAMALRRDRERAVWQAITTQLTAVKRYLVDPEDRAGFLRFTASLYQPLMNEVGYGAEPTEPSGRRELRRTAFDGLALLAEDPVAIAKARELAEQEVNQPGSVDGDILWVAVKAAARSGDATLYEQYVSVMKAEKDPERYYDFLRGLTFFRQPELVKRNFEMASGGEIRNQDVTDFINLEVSNPEVQHLAWRLFKDHWPQLEKRLSSFVRGDIVTIAGSFCDAEMRDDAKQFFTGKNSPAERSLRQTLERIDACVDLKEQQKSKAADWLSRHVR